MLRSRMYSFTMIFILTLTLLSLFPAFLLIEYNQQLILHGEVDFGVGFLLEDGVPALYFTKAGETVSLSDTPLGLLLDPSQRLLGRLLQWELKVGSALWS